MYLCIFQVSGAHGLEIGQAILPIALMMRSDETTSASTPGTDLSMTRKKSSMNEEELMGQKKKKKEEGDDGEEGPAEVIEQQTTNMMRKTASSSRGRRLKLILSSGRKVRVVVRE